MTETIDKALDDLSFDQETFDWLREQIGERMKEMEESGKVHLEALEARKERLEEDKKQLFWALVKNIVKEDDSQYQSEKERIENELIQIQEKIDELKNQSSEDLDSGIETLEVAQSFVDLVKRKRKSFDIKSKKADFKVLHSKLISNIIAGELIEGESYFDEESFVHEGIEIIYNEPFMTIFDLNLQKKLDEWEKAEGKKYRLKRRKTTSGTPGGI